MVALFTWAYDGPLNRATVGLPRNISRNMVTVKHESLGFELISTWPACTNL